MISKYLTNMNNLVQYIIMFLILLLIIYLIYKIYLVENDVYILNERLSKIELYKQPNHLEKSELENEEIEIATNFMNEIFSNQEEPSSIDIDEILKEDEKPDIKEEVFDLKKDVMTMEDNQSIISSSTNKKKLQKLNLDKLKEKCLELGISSEGTKANLIDRIIDENNKEV